MKMQHSYGNVEVEEGEEEGQPAGHSNQMANESNFGHLM